MSTVNVTVKAKTVEGDPAQDPLVWVEIRETFPRQGRLIGNYRLDNFDGQQSFPVELEDGTMPQWDMTATFTLFDSGIRSYTFHPATEDEFTWDLPLVTRLPNKWAPVFTPLQQLADATFAKLKAVIAGSGNVALKNGPALEVLKDTYDHIQLPKPVLAKMALLNIFAVLMEETDPEQSSGQGNSVPWFNAVNEIVLMDGERFVSKVNPGLFTSVKSIRDQRNGKYAGQGYSTEPDADFALHYENIPTTYGGKGKSRPENLVDMVTLKKKYQQGDVQLTVSRLRYQDADLYLLDCDMDEHDNIVGHTFDLAKHLISNKGTHPVDMHEYIVLDSGENSPDQKATIDLGYTLKPV